MDTQAALTAINELNNLLGSSAMRWCAWRAIPEKRAVVFEAWHNVIAAINPDAADEIVAAMRAEIEAADAKAREPWTLERIEGYIIGQAQTRAPMGHFLQWCHPIKGHAIVPDMPDDLWNAAWRNVIEREVIHVGKFGMVSPQRGEHEAIDPETKEWAVRMGTTGDQSVSDDANGTREA